MTLWRNAWIAVWREKALWLGLTALTGVLLVLAYIWLGLGVATLWQILAHAMLAVAWLALVVLAVAWTRRRLGVVNMQVASRRGAFWLAVTVSLVLALVVPYALVHWVPGFDSFTAEAASALVRVVLAGLVFTGALLWLHACGVALSSADAGLEHGQDSGAAASPD